MNDPTATPPVEQAILHAIEWCLTNPADDLDPHGPEAYGPTVHDIAHAVGNKRWAGVRTSNRGRINQRLNKLLTLSLIERIIGAREPSSEGWGRRPYRYRLTDQGKALLTELKRLTKEARP
jgi:hypothetical protein